MNLKIVLVEDSSDDAFVLQRALSKSGLVFTMQHLADGEEALNYFRSLMEDGAPAPHVIILDIKLPRLTGFDILEWLKKKSTMTRVPVIVHSGSSLAADKVRASELGAEAFVTKTHDCVVVVEKIRELFPN
jgi:DNA-binding response OmpR family regulator